MKSYTLQEAKAKLNKLVDEALAGEDVVLMRGSKIVASVRPLTEADLEITPQLTDRQAERLHKEIAASPKKTFRNAQEAVAYLKKLRPIG